MRRPRAAVVALLAIAVVLAGATPARAGDKGWDAAARVLTKSYGAKRQSRFALWLGGLAVHFAKPDGVRDVKIALFRNADATRDPDGRILEKAVADKLGPEWSRIVQVVTNHGERTHVFVRWQGEDRVELMVVAIAAGEATLVRAEIEPRRLGEFVGRLRRERN